MNTEPNSEKRFEEWSRSHFPPISKDKQWLSEADAKHAWDHQESYWHKQYEELANAINGNIQETYIPEIFKIKARLIEAERIMVIAAGAITSADPQVHQDMTLALMTKFWDALEAYKQSKEDK